jgi:hypothetical protein
MEKVQMEKSSENLVIIRAFGGKASIRAVLEAMPGCVMVCMPEHAAAIRQGKLPTPMLGFPEKDVFAYDPQAATAAERGTPIDWATMRLAF